MAPLAIFRLLFATRYSPFAVLFSADYIGQEPEEAGALDGARELALLLGGHRGDPARHDLAALGDVTLQQPHVLVIDLGRIGAGERTGLAAAEERPAGLRLGRCHGRHSSLVSGATSSPPSRGGRLSRSRRCSPRSRSRMPPRSRSRKPKPRSSRSRSRSALRIIAEGPSLSSSTRMVR